MGAPLSGIRVVDLSRLLPGPLASLILSDWGAEVTSVDSAHNPDYMHSVPPLCDDGISLFFHALHRGKARVSLDLRTELGKAQLTSLLMNADVLIESYRTAVLASLGFDDDYLRAHFPRLIICHLSGYGQSGEMAAYAGHDLNFLAETGLLGLFEEPKALPFPIADIAAGSFGAAMQIMAGILQRQRTGGGLIIDHNISAFCAALAIPQWTGLDSAYVLDGHQAAYSVYKTRDGHLAVGALEPKFWNLLVEQLGLPELANQGISSFERAAEVRSLVQKKLVEKTTSEWLSRLSPLNICVSPVRNFSDSGAKSLRNKGVILKNVTLRGQPVEVPQLPLFKHF